MQPAATLIVIGATGDLTGRLLLPALARLSTGGELAAGFAVLGAGPEPWTQAEFRHHASARLTAHAADLDADAREAFLDRVGFHTVDVTDPASLDALLQPFRGTQGVVLYLALPTELVTTTVAGLQALPLPPALVIAVEKPFGEDLSSATHLNVSLERLDPAVTVFRVDHVLGLPAIAALPSLSAAVPPVPAGAEITQVSILWEETLALEGRAAFYDRAGALKDLLQNHLLQILCMITREPPSNQSAAQGMAEGRLNAMKAVQIPSAADAVTGSRRARYTAGRLAVTGGAGGESVPDYVDESGVDANRHTETFAEVTLRVTTPRWAHTRFVLRAGKAMARRRRGILVQFSGSAEGTGQSWIDVDQVATDHSGSVSEPVGAGAPLEQVAYTRVLQSLLSGTFNLSVSAPESERAWSIFEPVLAAWAAQEVPLTDYPAGSTPPPALS